MNAQILPARLEQRHGRAGAAPGAARAYRNRQPRLVSSTPANAPATSTVQTTAPVFVRFRAAMAEAKAAAGAPDWQLGDPLPSDADARFEWWRRPLVRAILVFFVTLPVWLALYWIQLDGGPAAHPAQIYPIDGLKTRSSTAVPDPATAYASARFTFEARVSKAELVRDLTRDLGPS